MRLKYFILIFLFIGFAGFLFGQQEIRFSHITTDNGLSNNTVFPILQDSSGYMWFGTTDGLCRYDGNTIDIYRHKNRDSNSLSGNEINCLSEDQNHIVWIGTSYGLNSFNPITKQFKNYFFNKWSNNPRNNAISSVTPGVHRLLWVATGKGLYRMNIDSGKWINVKIIPDNPNGFHVRGIISTKEGRLFVTTDNGLFYTDNDGKLFYPAQAFNQLVQGNYFSSFYLDKKERLWIGLWEHSLVYELDSKTLRTEVHMFDTSKSTESNTHYSSRATLLLNDSVLMICAIISGSMQSGRLYLLNINNGKVVEYSKNGDDVYSLTNNHVYSLFEDKQNTIWIGTSDGVNYFNYGQQNFHRLEAPDANDSSVFKGYNTIVANNRGNTFWIYGDDGNLFNYKCTSSVPKFLGKVFLPKLDTFIRCIYPCGDSVMLATEKGVYILKIENGNYANPSISRFPTKPIDQENISRVLKDKSGAFWFATAYNGVYEYTPTNNEMKHYLYKNEPNVINPPVTIIDAICLAEDRNSNIWVGTSSSGFCCINQSSGQVKWNELLNNGLDMKSLGEIGDIFCDTDNIVYIATTRSGLLALDQQKGRIDSYTVDEGISNDDVAKIIPGDKNFLWIPTKKGLSCFDKIAKKFHNYFRANGLISDAFSYSDGIFNTGKIIFNSSSCIQYFDPSTLINNTLQVFPGFTSMQVNNKEYNADLLQKIFLGYKDNTISFTFSAFDFINNVEDKFAYKLEGLDEDWNYCGNRHYAEYTNLPGGDYTLKLKVQTPDGRWVETAHPVFLHIATPYWKTSWFIMLCGLAAFAMGYLFYYLKMQRKLEAERLRTRLARDLHDDIGSSLSSISILSDMAGRNAASTPEETQVIFNKISESSHRTMESMKDIVWTVNPANDLMDSLLTRMRIYCSEILEPKGIEYSFKLGEQIETSRLAMEQRRNFYLIFKEAINNIAKYSKCNNVNISIYKSEDKLEMKIADNGIGFDTVKANEKGNGLRNMAERARLMSGSITIESIEKKGTTITLFCPLT